MYSPLQINDSPTYKRKFTYLHPDLIRLHPITYDNTRWAVSLSYFYVKLNNETSFATQKL